jgi:hypothetical protein
MPERCVKRNLKDPVLRVKLAYKGTRKRKAVVILQRTRVQKRERIGTILEAGSSVN